MKRGLVIVIMLVVLTGCASNRKTAGVKIHTKTKVYQEQKQTTPKQEMWIKAFGFIMVSFIIWTLQI